MKKSSSVLNSRVVSGTSMYLRMIVGWDCYSALDIIRKLLGCGYSLSTYYLLNSGIGYIFYNNVSKIGYMNGASQMLIELGIIGSLLFILNIGAVIKNFLYDKVIMAVLISLLIIMFTCSCFEQLNMYIPIAVILSRRVIISKKSES